MLSNTRQYLRNRSSLSIGYLFALASTVLGIWVAALPQVKERLQLTDATLGLSLLLAPVGALTGVLLAPAVFKRIKLGNWMVGGHIAYCIAYILQVTAPHLIILLIALFLNGLTGFLNGVATNALVDRLEQKMDRRLMSTSHGMYSLGGGLSAALASVFYLFHVNSYIQIVLVALALTAGLFALRNEYQQHQFYIGSDSRLQLPSRGVLGLSFICFVTFMGEGCVADWSAIYLKESLLGTKAIAALGFAGFSVTMALGRFNGDALIPKLGAKRLAVSGALIAGAGFLLAVAFHSIATAVAGFTLIGLGFSCIVPILFSAATKVPGVNAVAGISAVASGGLIGFLIGPSMIGIVAEAYSVKTGLAIISILALLAAWAAWKNPYLASNRSPAEHLAYPDQLI